MSKPSVAAYLAAVRSAGLVDEAKLAATLREFEQKAGWLSTSADLAKLLEEKKLLKAWHNRRLLEKEGMLLVGEFQIVGRIGRASYRAEHVSTRQLVWLGISPRGRDEPRNAWELQLRTFREVSVIAHPHLLRMFGLGHEPDLVYLVCEHLEGRSLEEVVRDDGPLGYEQAADFIRQTADGLEKFHASLEAHRDIRPSNLRLCPQGIIKILGAFRVMDWGWEYEDDMRVMTSVDYLSPECQMDAFRVPRVADIYSLGCTLYFLLTGHPPFTEGTLAQRLMKHQTMEPPAITLDRPDAPAELLAICRKMQAKKPDHRYQTAAEVSQQLSAWLRSRACVIPLEHA